MASAPSPPIVSLSRLAYVRLETIPSTSTSTYVRAVACVAALYHVGSMFPDGTSDEDMQTEFAMREEWMEELNQLLPDEKKFKLSGSGIGFRNALGSGNAKQLDAGYVGFLDALRREFKRTERDDESDELLKEAKEYLLYVKGSLRIPKRVKKNVETYLEKYFKINDRDSDYDICVHNSSRSSSRSSSEGDCDDDDLESSVTSEVTGGLRGAEPPSFWKSSPR